MTIADHSVVRKTRKLTTMRPDIPIPKTEVVYFIDGQELSKVAALRLLSLDANGPRFTRNEAEQFLALLPQHIDEDAMRIGGYWK